MAQTVTLRERAPTDAFGLIGRVRADLPRLQEAMAAVHEDELVLIGRRHQRDNNSWMHNSERLTRGRPRHQLLMHPDDLARRGLADGARVRVTSRVGEVVTEVRGTDEMMPGVVSLPHGYGHQVDGVRMDNAAKVPGVLAVMATAGLYDDSGKWLYHMGLPAKSGVGGGIIAVSPGKFGIAVVSPPLDDAGNSIRAQRAITEISNALGGNPYAAKKAAGSM